MLLIKDCLNCDGLLRILSLISIDSNDFVDLYYMYDVYFGMTNSYSVLLRLYLLIIYG